MTKRLPMRAVLLVYATDVSQVSTTIFSGGVYGGGDGAVHYNLETQEWFGAQAVAPCIAQGSCGPRITSLPANAPD